MMKPYYILYGPPTFDLMNRFDKISHPNELLSCLCGKAPDGINESNFLAYLRFDKAKQRKSMTDALAMENYTLNYVGNMIAKCGAQGQIILADGKRRTLAQIIAEEGKNPAAVFITAMSSNFPVALAAATALNHGKIPVIIGGIHVSTSPADVDVFLRRHVPHPHLLAQVSGPADSENITAILRDLSKGRLREAYCGRHSLENGVWGHDNVIPLPPYQLENLAKIPLIGKMMVRKLRVNTAAPYVGCPYSCRFCSISTLPKNKRSFSVREPADFVDELKAFQKDGVSSHNRFFLLLPDNLLLGGQRLEEILDRMIDERLKINFAAQISIDVANHDHLLRKLRQAGATHFFIGLESLDIRNLEYVGKNAVGDIKRRKMSVAEYYRMQIRKIRSYGISVHGAFIFGLPFDYFNDLNDHSGVQVADFCIENRIGLQPSVLTDLPGSINFRESQKQGRCLYGRQGSWNYLVGLCLADLAETNRIPFDSLHNSPLLLSYMAYEAIRKVGARRRTFKNGLTAMMGAMIHPSLNGAASLKGRLEDGFWAFAAQLSIGLFKDHAELLVYSRDGVKGLFERLYLREGNSMIKGMFAPVVSNFSINSAAPPREVLPELGHGVI